MIVAQALVRARGRVLVESPGYPNAHAALRRSGARPVPVPMDVDGWDLDAVGRVLRDAHPHLAYLVPDFQNPTGNLMADAQREEYAALLRRTGTVPVVDESHQPLLLEGRRMPRPFAHFAPEAITVGSASKSLWGGLRVGWVRCPDELADRLLSARLALDLGSPVLEQLTAARLLAERDRHWAEQRGRLRSQRDVLAVALSEQLPSWRHRLPRGGLSLWCELPAGVSALRFADEAERQGVVVSPGPVFAVDGGLDSFVRVPYSRPEHELRQAVERLAAAWTALAPGSGDPAPRRRRVMVA
jgi:DNA-binding transcriptional MocR family regulator